MKKLGILIGALAALGAASIGASNVGAAGGNWGLGVGESTSLPCAVTTGDATGDSCNGVWTLTSDIVLDTALTRYNGSATNLTIDLNGHNITSTGAIALVNGPTLTIKDSTGGGFIKSTGGGYGTIYAQTSHLTVESGTLISTVPNNSGIVWSKGASTDIANAASINIGKDAILKYEGAGYGYGVGIDKIGSNDTAYGISVNIDGVIGGGLYINGSIQHTANIPQFTISSTAVLTSAGPNFPAVYAAGYANWVFEDGATVTGEGSALAIKSGKVTINGGTFTSTGADTTPTAGFSNGVNASGATIQIESNKGYAGDVDLTILGGTFISEKGRVFYEYLDTESKSGPTTETAVSKVAIKGGDFVAKDASKAVFMLSEEFATTIKGFVHGGSFSSDPTAYAADGVTFTKNANGEYATAEKTPATPNPETSDNITTYAIIGTIGTLGLISSIVLIRKRTA